MHINEQVGVASYPQGMAGLHRVIIVGVGRSPSSLFPSPTKARRWGTWWVLAFGHGVGEHFLCARFTGNGTQPSRHQPPVIQHHPSLGRGVGGGAMGSPADLLGQAQQTAVLATPQG